MAPTLRLLVNREQGRRRPDGPARVLPALIAKDPGIVQRVLGKAARDR